MVFKAKPWKRQERRRHQRVNVVCPVLYAVVPKGSEDDQSLHEECPAICRNLSAGGMLLEVKELKEELLLCCNLFSLKWSLPGEDKPLTALARLVKAERSHTHSYFLRLCFIRIAPEFQKRIENFVLACRKKRRGEA